MTLRRYTISPVDLDVQCWLLTACCALYQEEFAACPELDSLRQAIYKGHRGLISQNLEATSVALAGKLSPRELYLCQRLAQTVRSGNLGLIRRIVTALSRASLAHRRQVS